MEDNEQVYEVRCGADKRLAYYGDSRDEAIRVYARCKALSAAGNGGWAAVSFAGRVVREWSRAGGEVVALAQGGEVLTCCDPESGADGRVRIVYRRRSDDVHVCVEGRPGLWAAGRNLYEAVGDLVVCHPEAFGVVVSQEEGQR